eukprot:scaffold70883_cov19-Tisochrysis_lutea.AAC.3
MHLPVDVFEPRCEGTKAKGFNFDPHALHQSSCTVMLAASRLFDTGHCLSWFQLTQFCDPKTWPAKDGRRQAAWCEEADSLMQAG